MESKLAAYFRQHRLARGLSPSQLAEQAGFPDIRNRSVLIERFEDNGHIFQKMLPRLAAALGIPPSVVLRLMLEDWLNFFDDWLFWATTPIRPMLSFLFFMAVDRIRLPRTIRTLEQAETFASALAGERCHPATLLLSRRFKIEFDAEGKVKEYCETVPARWIWQAEQKVVRAVERERIATAFVWPVNPVEEYP